jgi:hypothetical protein
MNLREDYSNIAMGVDNQKSFQLLINLIIKMMFAIATTSAAFVLPYG